ncbi:MAG: hypothetical protein WCW65_02575 [Candidatus Paceibacterota bacterium]
MKKLIGLGLVLGPLSAFAVIDDAPGTVGYIIATVASWISYIVPVLITLAVAYFIWGVISFMTSSDEEAKKMGRTKIINGLIGLFVIVAFWGIIAMIQKTFSVDSSTGGTGTMDAINQGLPIIGQ